MYSLTLNKSYVKEILRICNNRIQMTQIAMINFTKMEPRCNIKVVTFVMFRTSAPWRGYFLSWVRLKTSNEQLRHLGSIAITFSESTTTGQPLCNVFQLAAMSRVNRMAFRCDSTVKGILMNHCYNLTSA